MDSRKVLFVFVVTVNGGACRCAIAAPGPGGGGNIILIVDEIFGVDWAHLEVCVK